MARESQRIDAESLASSFQTADFTQNAAYDPRHWHKRASLFQTHRARANIKLFARVRAR